MRTLLLLTVGAVLLAGCATDNGTGTDGNNSSVSGSCSPKAILTDDHVFTDAPGSAAFKALKPDAGCTTLSLNVTFDNAQGLPGGVASGISVKLGSATCTLADGPNTGPVKCGPKPTTATGAKQVDYTGSGAISAHVVVTES